MPFSPIKLLFVLPYIPLPTTFGGALRVFHILKLAARENEISIVTYGEAEREGCAGPVSDRVSDQPARRVVDK